MKSIRLSLDRFRHRQLTLALHRFYFNLTCSKDTITVKYIFDTTTHQSQRTRWTCRQILLCFTLWPLLNNYNNNHFSSYELSTHSCLLPIILSLLKTSFHFVLTYLIWVQTYPSYACFVKKLTLPRDLTLLL